MALRHHIGMKHRIIVFLKCDNYEKESISI